MLFKNNFTRVLMICAVACAFSGCVSLITPKVEKEVAKLKAGQYSLDKTHAAVLFKIQHLGLSTYVGRFNEVDATLDFDPNNSAQAKLNATIEIDSLDINDDGLKKDLMGGGWFNQSKYPQAKFTTLSVSPKSENELEFIGNLDWRGVVKPVTLLVTFHGGANNILTGKYTIGFSAKGSFLRSEFGMDKFTPLVGDEVQIEAFAEFLKNTN